jgi:fluoride exporter
MSGAGFLAVGAGAAIGAWIRWWLSVALNPVLPSLLLGTLAANLVGGYLMGLAMAIMEHFQTLSHELRLLMTTGFLGGLTTFSAFSGEATALLMQQQYAWLAALTTAHVLGSILMTVAGIATVRALLGA